MNANENIGPRVPKALVSSITGLLVVAGHIALAVYIFSLDALEELAAVEIAAPVTITYAITVVRWFVDNQGNLPRVPTVGVTYVALIALLFGSAFGCLVTILLLHDDGMDVKTANVAITAVEAAFGALLVLVINDLFPAREVEDSKQKQAVQIPNLVGNDIIDQTATEGKIPKT
jgi:hypothetical protein